MAPRVCVPIHISAAASPTVSGRIVARHARYGGCLLYGRLSVVFPPVPLSDTSMWRVYTRRLPGYSPSVLGMAFPMPTLASGLHRRSARTRAAFAAMKVVRSGARNGATLAASRFQMTSTRPFCPCVPSPLLPFHARRGRGLLGHPGHRPLARLTPAMTVEAQPRKATPVSRFAWFLSAPPRMPYCSMPIPTILRSRRHRPVQSQSEPSYTHTIRRRPARRCRVPASARRAPAR